MADATLRGTLTGRNRLIAATLAGVVAIAAAGLTIRSLLRDPAPQQAPTAAKRIKEISWDRLTPQQRTQRELLAIVADENIRKAAESKRWDDVAKMLAVAAEKEKASSEGTGRPGPAAAVLGEAQGLTQALRNNHAGAAAHFLKAADLLSAPQAHERALLLGRAAEEHLHLGQRDVAADLWRRAVALLAPLRSPESAAARAGFEIRIGDMLSAEGDVTGALDAYAAAAGGRKTLAEASPTDARRWREFAASLEKVGEAHLSRGDFARATQAFSAHLAAFVHALKVEEPDIPAPPEDVETLRELAGHYDRLGKAASSTDPQAGVAFYRKSLEMNEKAASAKPSQAHEPKLAMAETLGRIGDAFLRAGDVNQALEAHRHAAEVFQDLAVNKKHSEAMLTGRSRTHLAIGEILSREGNVAGAIEAARASLDVAKFEIDAWALRDSGRAHALIADALLQQGDAAGAAKSYRDAVVAYEKIKHRTPYDRTLLADAHGKVGNLLMRQADDEGALAAFKAGLAVSTAAVTPENQVTPKPSVEDMRFQATAHERIGDLLLRNDRPAGAAGSFRDALAALAGLGTPADIQRDRARLLARIGDALARQSDVAGAIESHREALRATQSLPAHVRTQREIAATHDRIGDLLLARGDAEGAREAYGEALALRAESAARTPDDAEARIDLGLSHARLLAAAAGASHARALATIVADLRARGINDPVLTTTLERYRTDD